MVIGMTAGMVALFAAIGYGIGLLVDQVSAGIFIAVLISYPFTQWALIRAIRRVHVSEQLQEQATESDGSAQNL